MLREDPQIGNDRPDPGSPGGLSRTIKAWTARPLHVSRAVLCSLLLCAGMVLGTAAVSQTTSNSAIDRDIADRYDRAARAGDDVAQFYLGALYSQGVGRPQSDTEAFAWIQQAAQRGNAQAMLVAAGLTALGKGTPKDYVTSYKWAFLVAEGAQAQDLKNGGRQLITMLQPRMTADQIQSAKSQAYQFRAIGTPAATPAAAPAPITPVAAAPAAVPPTVVAPAPAAPTFQSTTPTGGPQQVAHAPPPTPTQTAVALEAQKHLNKENVDRLMKNVPSQYRKRFGF